MWDANVGTTTRVLDAAEAAATPRIVYVSTVNVFGNTRGSVVDETYRRDLADGLPVWYDETKYGAHEVAEQRIAAGAPIVIVLPSQVYGPGDHSELRRAAQPGQRRPAAVPGARRRRRRARPRRRPRRRHRRGPRPRRRRGVVRPVRPADDAALTRSRSRRGSAATARPGCGSRPASLRRDGAARAAGRPAEPRRGRHRRRPASPTGRPAAEAETRARVQRRATIETGLPRHVRRGLTTLDPMARELPMFSPPGGGAPRPAGARDDRDGRLGHAAPPPPRLDQVAPAVRRRTTTT